MEARLLATDLDGTVLGDEAGEAAFRAWAAAHPETLLAYATGRELAAVAPLVDSGRLPRPRFVCPSVGSAIFDADDPGNALGRAFAARVGPDWDKAALLAAGRGPGVETQDIAGPGADFHAAFRWNGDPAALAALRARLAGFGAVRIVASHGAYIDVLPAAVGKGQALRFIAAALGLAPDRVAAAGDSENDIDLCTAGYWAILPANACAELRRACAGLPGHRSALPAGRGLAEGLRSRWG